MVIASKSANSDLLHQVDEFPPYNLIGHGDLLGLALGANTTTYTHGLHRFPAKYIPQVPRWALRQFANERSVVLDPFMGSGTTLVEGICGGIKTYGVDIDPLARLITKAKTSTYDLSHLRKLSEIILAAEGTFCHQLFMPMRGVSNIEHWFGPSAWNDLCVLFKAIESVPASVAEKIFLYCVFSSILRWVSNADDQTQKTYVSGTLKKNPPPVWETFRRFLIKALAGVESLTLQKHRGSAEILDGTALSVPLRPNSLDLIITSPPYMDSVDYMYNFMLEYFWLGPYLGVPTRADFNLMRRTPVGAKNPLAPFDSIPESITMLIHQEEIPVYRCAAVLGYFRSMHSHFREAARLLREGGRYILVVGNSRAENGVIPVHDCLIRLARDADLHMEKAFAYRIRRHYMKFPRKGRGGIILMDWVITLRKSKKAIIQSEDRLPLPNISIGEDEVAN